MAIEQMDTGCDKRKYYKKKLSFNDKNNNIIKQEDDDEKTEIESFQKLEHSISISKDYYPILKKDT